MTNDRPSNMVKWIEDAGVKHDTGKARFDLVHWPLVLELARVLTHGAEIYGDTNYRLVENPRKRYFAALMRHIVDYAMGQRIDPKSGLKTLGHVMANLQILHELDEHERDADPNS